MSDAGEAAALYSRLYHEAKAELAKANKDIQVLAEALNDMLYYEKPCQETQNEYRELANKYKDSKEGA